jgi:hypothetical protein
MSTSADGGLTWGAPTPTADNAHGLGGQPVVQPSGRVVVPYEGLSGASVIRLFSSDDGGATWNASVQISTRTSHGVPGVRTSPLPSAEIPRRHRLRRLAGPPLRTGRHSQRHHHEHLGRRHHLVTAHPHLVGPDRQRHRSLHSGLAVDRMTAGSHTLLALTYYSEQPAGCVGDVRRLAERPHRRQPRRQRPGRIPDDTQTETTAF